MIARWNRGSWRPVLVAGLAVVGADSMLVAAPQGVTAKGSAVGASTVDIPEAVQKILTAAVEAMGGREAINEIDAMHTRMELSTEMGSMTAEHWWQKPNKSLSKQVIPQMGEMSTGTNGSVWWRHTAMTGYQIISEEESSAAGPASFLTKVLDVEKSVKDEYRALEAPGSVDFDGRTCKRIRGVREDGGGTTMLYFDAATGLPAGAESTEKGRAGTQTSTMYMRDWKRVDTIKLFHTMEMRAGEQTARARVQLVEFNNVPASMFELPEEVEKMASGRPKTTGDSTGRTIESFDRQQRAMIDTILRSTEHVDDPEALRQMITNMSRGLGYMPQEQKEAMEFAIRKIEERIRELGG